MTFNFRKLRAYQYSRILVRDVYILLRQYPADERFCLCAQLRRASVSITSNLAEGLSRSSYKEQLHFVEMSYGSLMEVLSQLELSYDLGYITQEQLESIETSIEEIAKLESGLKKSIESKLTNM